MATQQNEEVLQISDPAPTGIIGCVEAHYKKLRKHAEEYPYVWGSYIVVYGGFGMWMAYRARKLRRTEDNIRVLQARLRKLVDEEKSTNVPTSSSVGKSPSSSAVKTSKSSSG